MYLSLYLIVGSEYNNCYFHKFRPSLAGLDVTEFDTPNLIGLYFLFNEWHSPCAGVRLFQRFHVAIVLAQCLIHFSLHLFLHLPANHHLINEHDDNHHRQQHPNSNKDLPSREERRLRDFLALFCLLVGVWADHVADVHLHSPDVACHWVPLPVDEHYWVVGYFLPDVVLPFLFQVDVAIHFWPYS